jgi:hypothetical protein
MSGRLLGWIREKVAETQIKVTPVAVDLFVLPKP